MKLKIMLMLLIILGVGCSTFKELEPDPELSPLEKGYVQLKDDDENFELEKDGKYFIKFPKAVEKNFYLILSTNLKGEISTYFTDFFDDGKGEIKKISDESNGIDSLLVYRIGQDKEFYYWVIDNVKKDLLLTMNYRYSPIWRFKFEVKYEEYKGILEDNKTDKKVYNSINENFNFNGLNFDKEISLLDLRKKNIEAMNKELADLEDIFPNDMANSSDAAYKNYLELKSNVRNELNFNTNFRLVLTSFRASEENGNNMGGFLAGVNDMLELVSNPNRFSQDIIEKAKNDFSSKLSKSYSYFNSLLNNKNDVKPFELPADINDIDKLYRMCSKNIPIEFSDVVNYISKFNAQAEKMSIYYDKESEMKTRFKNTPSYPDNSFYPNMLKLMREMKSIVPTDETSKISRFANYNSTNLMSTAVTNAKRNTVRLELGFQVAELLVPKLNNLKRDEQYKEMINMLNENRELDYLLNQYSGIDNLYIDQQKGVVKNNLTKYGFGKAENTLRQLFNEKVFIFPNNVERKKNAVVEQYEEELYDAVKRMSKVSVDSFVARNQMTITNVKALYQDSSFVPVYQLSFSSKGSNDLAQKRAQIQDYLDEMKYHQLPENAIKNIYNDFVRNINNKGVEKVRAIVEHGRYYKGTDKSVKTIIDECDVNTPKWITKPMDYREVYVAPVTTSKGTNEYMFKLRLQIPSDAQFPVFDINIKLPEEVAKNANKEQWYEKITINNKLIKNEGRVKITAPVSSNGFEAQISPVQMDKDGKNVLEVRFKYPGFKIFKVSVMAQKPIIKKN